MREFTSLAGLDAKYSKIDVQFDKAFVAVAEKLLTINGWQKKDGKIENKIIGSKADLSGDIQAQLSFNQEMDSQGRSLDGMPPDISRISFDYEQQNCDVTGSSGNHQGKAPQGTTHSSMEETGSGSHTNISRETTP